MDVQAPHRVARRLLAVVASATIVATFVATGLAFAVTGLSAQVRPPASVGRTQRELHLAATAATTNAVHLAAGVNIRNGWYVRTGAALGLGIVADENDNWRTSYRLDVTSRFLLDPFAERRRAFYAGGGLTVRADGEANPVARLLVVVGIEGNPQRRRVPAIELGLGGGVRLGLVFRMRREGSMR
jgi:hypothetical protein